MPELGAVGLAQTANSSQLAACPRPPQEVEQVTFSTALAGLTDHLAVGLKLQVVYS